MWRSCSGRGAEANQADPVVAGPALGPRGNNTKSRNYRRTANVARAFSVMAGEGRPPTTFLCCTRQSRGWPASAGHDTRARGMSARVNGNAGWYKCVSRHAAKFRVMAGSVSWPAKAGHPRLSFVVHSKVVDGGPSPARTAGAAGATHSRAIAYGARYQTQGLVSSMPVTGTDANRCHSRRNALHPFGRCLISAAFQVFPERFCDSRVKCQSVYNTAKLDS